MSFDPPSDAGEPVPGSLRTAGLPAASPIVPPLRDRASGPAYSRSPVRSFGRTAYTNTSVCEPPPESYEARRSVWPVSSSICGDPVT